MNKDMHNNMRCVRCLSPVALGTATTGIGKVVDRQGYGGVEFIVSYGTVTSATAVITLVVQEADVTTTGSFTSVADAYLLGTELLASLPAATRTSGTGKNVSKRVGYVGNSRYVRAKLSAVGTFAVPVSITACLHTPELAPTANP